MKKLKGDHSTAIIYTDSIEPQCLAQLNTMLKSPAFNGPIRIMPDCHLGKGCVIGFTMPIKDKIIPNTIGVDIGCGVLACKLEGPLPDWETVDKTIRKVVPLGFNRHKIKLTQPEIKTRLIELDQKLSTKTSLSALINRLKIPAIQVISQLGTLGGGNHFIEIAKSKSDSSIWLIIHSGSRKLGHTTCNYWQSRAINYQKTLKTELISKIISTIPKQHLNDIIPQLDFPENDLCYLSGILKDDYINDMKTAQKFAKLNRSTMAQNISNALGLKITNKIESIHNYIDDNNIIRKGAISAHKSQQLIIPFNMKDGSIIGIGKSNPAWNNSAPHGAGRLMSRTKAKSEISLSEFQKTMQDVWSSSVNSQTLDESPQAYKPSKEVISKLSPTIDIIDYLIPLYNLKDSNFKGKYSKLNNKTTKP